jgi:hypothetical protein
MGEQEKAARGSRQQDLLPLLTPTATAAKKVVDKKVVVR